jgi:3-hydroxyisobutyrate dehydrogenase-like beta-hydroxyacid dehydrogenase
VTEELAANLARDGRDVLGIPVSAGSLLRGPGHVRLPFGGSEETVQRLERAIPHAVGTVLSR